MASVRTFPTVVVTNSGGSNELVEVPVLKSADRQEEVLSLKYQQNVRGGKR